MINESGRVALVVRGDRCPTRRHDIQNSRLGHVDRALADVGLMAEPAIYGDDMADEFRDEILSVQGVLVWGGPGHRHRGPKLTRRDFPGGGGYGGVGLGAP